ncbi:nuclear transport factor 2 family protein [Rhodococcus sp. LB1]|uniref:nuclear transport factor 2 family protein n=1 Tax=Rhodococcus sp. LB1 TaxID=1807499 RepID=UPI00077A2703|nr:nuclear transport factor 2 family protein [Rhodococcus sp. LB1]KXX62203.1 DUF4440 domain-containing protein [Rhodococcus sp. LB1]RZK69673.1 MAG: nuclear transport factor 2 family protein [Rhodococcus sp. (in: high G+C Gram-positive bacteria)]
MTGIRTDIRGLERERYEAMQRGDVTALDRLLSEHLRYTHSHGGCDTKQDYLGALTREEVSYETLSHTTDHHDAVAGAVILTGTMAATVRRADGIRQVRSVTSSVWVKEDDGRWRLRIFHATNLAQ